MKKVKMLLAVLSLCVLCGCGLASESQTNANGDTKSQTEDNSAGKQKEKIVVGTPDNLEVSVNSEYAIISWGQGKNATGYEYDLGSGIKNTEKRQTELEGFVPGSETVVKVRAYNDTEETTVYSEWKSLTVIMPEIDINNLTPFSAGSISRPMFEKWAEMKDPKYELTESDECYIYTVRFSDKSNEGLWNKIKRGGKAAWSSFWKGYAETVENETANGENILKGILKNRGVDNYISDVEDSATLEGGLKAAKAAWAAMKVEPDYVYYYFFEKDIAAKGAVFFERHFLQKNHEDYPKEMAERFLMTEMNGVNCFTFEATDCGRRIYFAVDTEKVQGVDRWVDYAYSDKLHFK